jgi:hypothetical protein
MKKFLLVLLLSAGATTFASTGKVVRVSKIKPVVKTEKTVKWTCTVGDVTVSSQNSTNPCKDAHDGYCQRHKCVGSITAE